MTVLHGVFSKKRLYNKLRALHDVDFSLEQGKNYRKSAVYT